MWRRTIVLLFFGLHAAHAVLGRQANIEDFPFTVAWIDPTQTSSSIGAYFCAGAIITSQHVLTAAQCFLNISGGSSKYVHRNALAIVGATNLDVDENKETHTIQNVIIHPSWTPTNFRLHPSELVDLAVVKLRDHISFGDSHIPQALIVANDMSIFLSSPGEDRAEVIGWGQKPPNLPNPFAEFAQVTIREAEHCLGDLDHFANGQPQDFERQNHICGEMNNDGPCTGDEGAPLFVQKSNEDEFFLIGVYSGMPPGGECFVDFLNAPPTPFGFDFDFDDENLPRPNHQRYVNVRTFGPWIQQVVGITLPYRYPTPTRAPPTPRPAQRSNNPAECSRILCEEGGEAPSLTCWCDIGCNFHGDCCENFDQVCSGGLFGGTTGTGNINGLVDSCAAADACGYKAGICWCDQECLSYGDCCSDFAIHCGLSRGGALSCNNRCGGKGVGCWCDDKCNDNQDCCPDYHICRDFFRGTGTCAGNCGFKSGGCWCDESCVENGDCCPNYFSRCGEAGSCEGYCGHPSGDCFCDTACIVTGDCCSDFPRYCAHINHLPPTPNF